MAASASPLDDIKAAVERAERPRPKMANVPTNASPEYLRMWHTLKRLASRGCSRLTPPSTCRAKNGYPENEWCEGCIAAEGLGIDREWFQLR